MTEDELNRALDQAAECLRSASRVCVLTGAGVSAESGVPTFRASDGLWENYRIEEVATPQAFARDPALVWRFYNLRRANLAQVRPNPGHYALAELENRWGDGFTLVTQNIDNLHRLAGSRNLLELHGNLWRVRCVSCHLVENRGLEPLGELPECPRCLGRLRPDIVWFGELLPEDVLEAARTAARNCDVLLVVGTSAVVYPAASLIPLAKQGRSPGAKVIEINLERTEASELADIGLYAPSGKVLPALVQRLRN